MIYVLFTFLRYFLFTVESAVSLRAADVPTRRWISQRIDVILGII